MFINFILLVLAFGIIDTLIFLGLVRISKSADIRFEDVWNSLSGSDESVGGYENG